MFRVDIYIAAKSSSNSKTRRGLLHRCNRFSGHSITGSDREIGNGIKRFRAQKYDGRLEKLPDPDM